MRAASTGSLSNLYAHRITASSVAIPVRNEEAAIGPCLAALFAQTEPPDQILLLLNNCTDGTEDVARTMARLCPSILRIVTRKLAPQQSSAGIARGLAIDLAASLAGPRGAVLTTDADGRVPPEWVARNLTGLRGGADVVCGTATIDPDDERALRREIVEDDAREACYTRLLDEIDSVIDPNPDDPWPRHTQHSGASIAFSVAALRAIGGVPRVAIGEDRALIEAALKHDARIRHDPEIDVVVSGRMVGRAEGGMAATIARRMIKQDQWADDRLEPVEAAIARSILRAEARRLWQKRPDRREISEMAHGLAMSEVDALAAMFRLPRFGAVWQAIERASPRLERRPVAMHELAALISEATNRLAGYKSAFESEPLGRLPATEPSIDLGELAAA
ncbi:glycosyltransferase family A protein [Acidisoma sp. S159]|uniref:glycosyltransferase family 2 protein n=1 Tax=Acidisoma sp. S159 TaxID=1747225 RepID=UPI00131A99C3|nr:glycosyltransferase family A protein [Acidisoma sp. S159]